MGTLAVFFVFEVPALRDAVDGNTLSEYVWNLATGWRAVIIAGLTWLVIHFARKR